MPANVSAQSPPCSRKASPRATGASRSFSWSHPAASTSGGRPPGGAPPPPDDHGRAAAAAQARANARSSGYAERPRSFPPSRHYLPGGAAGAGAEDPHPGNRTTKPRASAGRHARTWPGTPAAQRHDDEFGAQRILTRVPFTSNATARMCMPASCPKTITERAPRLLRRAGPPGAQAARASVSSGAGVASPNARSSFFACVTSRSP